MKIGGVIPAMLTPFTRGGDDVDYDRAAALAQHLAGKGVDGLFLAGTTGEGLLLDLDERRQLLEVVLDAVGKRVTVMTHAGCLSTRETVTLVQHAAKVGAAAAGVVAPGFFHYDDIALKRFFVDVAKAADGFPIMLYNLPQCAGNRIPPRMVIELAHEVDNIVGIKDSAGVMQDLNVVVGGVPKSFRVINGCDQFTMQAMATGAAGSVASNANAFPGLFRAIQNAVAKGNLKKAFKEQQRLTAVCSTFDQYGGAVAPIKESLRLRGFDAGYVRPPQRELTAAEKRAFAKRLEANGGLDV